MIDLNLIVSNTLYKFSGLFSPSEQGKLYPVSLFSIIPVFSMQFISFSITGFCSSFIAHGQTKNATLLYNFKCTSTCGHVPISSYKIEASCCSSVRLCTLVYCSFVNLESLRVMFHSMISLSGHLSVYCHLYLSKDIGNLLLLVFVSSA